MRKDVDVTDADGWVLCDGKGRPPCTPPSCAKPSYIKASVYDIDLSMRFAPTLESRRVVAFGPEDDSIIERFGQSFRWDPASGHQTVDELEPLRLLGDAPMCGLARHPPPPSLTGSLPWPPALVRPRPYARPRSPSHPPWPQGRRDRGARADPGRGRAGRTRARRAQRRGGGVAGEPDGRAAVARLGSVGARAGGLPAPPAFRRPRALQREPDRRLQRAQDHQGARAERIPRGPTEAGDAPPLRHWQADGRRLRERPGRAARRRRGLARRGARARTPREGAPAAAAARRRCGALRRRRRRRRRQVGR